MKKRLLSLLLAMLMVVSILPVTANADLSVGHLIDVRFQVLYLDSGLKLGYNLGPSEKTTFVCQYTTKHSATAASSHIISIRDIQAAAVRMQMNTGCVFVGWTKRAVQIQLSGVQKKKEQQFATKEQQFIWLPEKNRLF